MYKTQLVLYCYYLCITLDDHCCVSLKPIEGEEGSDYINASWIDVRSIVHSMH